MVSFSQIFAEVVIRGQLADIVVVDDDIESNGIARPVPFPLNSARARDLAANLTTGRPAARGIARSPIVGATIVTCLLYTSDAADE